VNPLSRHRKGAASSPFSCFATKGGAKGKEGFAPYPPYVTPIGNFPLSAQVRLSDKISEMTGEEGPRKDGVAGFLRKKRFL